MGLIRKRSLKQLMDIQKMMNKIGDIGEESTDQVEDHYDYKNDTDVDSEKIFDMSNDIQKLNGSNIDPNYLNRVGQGNLGECIGDLADQDLANNYFQHNPLNDSFLDTYEEFDLQYNWASSWKRNLTPKNKLKKVEENVQYRIKRFKDI